MTRQADFKRRVRARMAKTGESYATARSRLLTEDPETTPDIEHPTTGPLNWMPEALHISNGDATDVPGTGLARRVVYWRDILHEGRCPRPRRPSCAGSGPSRAVALGRRHRNDHPRPRQAGRPRLVVAH